MDFFRILVASLGADQKTCQLIGSTLTRRFGKAHVHFIDEAPNTPSKQLTNHSLDTTLLVIVGNDSLANTDFLSVLNQNLPIHVVLLNDANLHTVLENVAARDNSTATATALNRLRAGRLWKVASHPRRDQEKSLAPLMDAIERRRYFIKQRFYFAVAALVLFTFLLFRYAPRLAGFWEKPTLRNVARQFLVRGAKLQVRDRKREVISVSDLPTSEFEIERLDLTEFPLTDNDWRWFPQLAPAELILRNTNTTDTSLRQLSPWKSLKTINLRNTLVTTSGKELLNRRLPNCEIVYDPNTTTARWALETGLASSIPMEVEMHSHGTRGRFECTDWKKIPDKPAWILSLALTPSGPNSRSPTHTNVLREQDLHRLQGLNELTTLRLDIRHLPDAAFAQLPSFAKLTRLTLLGREIAPQSLAQLQAKFSTTTIEVEPVISEPLTE